MQSASPQSGVTIRLQSQFGKNKLGGKKPGMKMPAPPKYNRRHDGADRLIPMV
jgi:hypothetical protein